MCLIAAHGLRWQPAGFLAARQSAGAPGSWLQAGAVIFIRLIIFSGIAGYFVCFWPGTRPVRRVVWLVCAPASIGLGLMFGRVFYLSAPPTSVLESMGNLAGDRFRLAGELLWRCPEGFQITLFGLLLVGIFLSRMAFGVSSLPVKLLSARSSEAGLSEWRRLQVVIFVLVGPLFLVSSVLTFVCIGIPFYVLGVTPHCVQGIWFSRLASVAHVAAACGVILWTMGKENRRTIAESIRMPDRTGMFLAMAFPVGIGMLISAGNFLIDRAWWAAREFGRLSPPQIKSYFEAPDTYLLLLVFGAFFEEIVFRGLLQGRFVQRYGMYRGMFFVGVVWSAFHFYSDFSFSPVTDLIVLERIGTRLFTCVILSFVFGWLTLRSKSVIPSTVAHAFYNILIFAGFGMPFSGKGAVRLGLWAVLAYALFRYWPVTMDGPKSDLELPTLENEV